MTDIISISRLCPPLYSEAREAYTGAGWYFGGRRVAFTDGSTAVHTLWSFEDSVDAFAAYDELKKLIARPS